MLTHVLFDPFIGMVAQRMRSPSYTKKKRLLLAPEWRDPRVLAPLFLALMVVLGFAYQGQSLHLAEHLIRT